MARYKDTDHGKSVTAAAMLHRNAVARDGGLCVVCGGVCGPEDVRRRCERDPLRGDTAMNFVAMCRACQDFLGKKLPPPARRVYHFYDASRFRRTMRRTWNIGLFVLGLTVYGALWASAGWAVYQGFGNPFSAIATGVLMAMLLGIAYRIAVLGRDRPPTARVVHHHTFEPQSVRVVE